MGGPVVVVTDSTAYLPAEVAEDFGVRVVPLQVVLGGRSGAEGSEVTPADVATALADWVPVSTSRPTPAEFAAVYRSALSAGAAGVVSLHLSRELSGTWDSARMAAEEVGSDAVRVVDSRSAAMGLGFAVLAAAQAARPAGRSRTRTRPRSRRRHGPRRSSTSTRWSTCAGAAGSARPRRCSARRCR